MSKNFLDLVSPRDTDHPLRTDVTTTGSGLIKFSLTMVNEEMMTGTMTISTMKMTMMSLLNTHL